MAIDKCRTTKNHDRKREIIERYKLTPGPYCHILPHQQEEERDGCCGPLTDKFFQFVYTPKTPWLAHPQYFEESGSFYVGEDCGRQFVALLKEQNDLDQDYQIPTCFNALKRPPSVGGKKASRGGSGKRNDTLSEKTQLNSEIELVLQILAIVCRKPLRQSLNKILTHIQEFPKKDNYKAVNWINDAVRKHYELGGKSLREAMNREQSLSTLQWRKFSFFAIERVLRNTIGNDLSFIDPNAEFLDENPEFHEIKVRKQIRSGNWWCLWREGEDDIFLNNDKFEDICEGDRFRVRIGEGDFGPLGVKKIVITIIDKLERDEKPIDV